MGLVQNRVCGDCTVCCTVAPLVSETIRKLPNVPCPHSAGAGCAIYTTRPTACRESYCGWRFYPELDDGWRPDISGVLILTEQDVPAKYLGRGGLKFLLVDADTSIRSETFVGYICALVSRGVPVTVSVQGPPGHWPVKAFVNDRLRPSISRRDTAAAADVLAQVAQELRTGGFEPAEF